MVETSSLIFSDAVRISDSIDNGNNGLHGLITMSSAIDDGWFQQQEEWCQLLTLFDSAESTTFTDKVRCLGLRTDSKLRRDLKKTLKVLKGHPAAKDRLTAGCTHTFSEDIQVGDAVEVLSVEEIMKTLDNSGMCEKMAFLEGMEKYSGKRFIVEKKVNRMFDQHLGRIVRLKGTVLLKNVLCEGRKVYDKEGCDRYCFFFWKEKWLRKVNSKELVLSNDNNIPRIIHDESTNNNVIVEILPIEEILPTLDEKRRAGGVRFVRGMEKFAGRKFEILRRVRVAFDGRDFKLKRLKNTLLLKDAVCGGCIDGNIEVCDLSCFYYWDERWLKKIERT
jgi:hypothetical protein